MPLEKPDAAGQSGRNLADVLAACSREELLRYVHTLERRALHDPLTGLANRALLTDRLQQAAAFSRRYASPFALLVCDLDGFKEVNDRHGHDVGDRVLCTVSERLAGVLRASDSVARLGGDEFAVLLPDTDRAGAKVVSDKIAAAMKEPVRVDRLSLHVGVSVGVSMFPQDAADVAALVRRADRQMYGVKGRRRAPLRRFARGLALGAVMWIWAAVVGAVLLDSLGEAGRLPDLAAPPSVTDPVLGPESPQEADGASVFSTGRSLRFGGAVEEVALASATRIGRQGGGSDEDRSESSGRRRGSGGGTEGPGTVDPIGDGGGGDIGGEPGPPSPDVGGDDDGGGKGRGGLVGGGKDKDEDDDDDGVGRALGRDKDKD